MKMRDWITLFSSLVLIGAAFILGMRCQAGKTPQAAVVHDTLKLSELVRDTVLRWYERIVWKEAEPETVLVYRDTIKPESVWGRWPEAIISLDYSQTRSGRGNLSFTSLAPVSDSSEERKGTLKDYSYRVGERFAIRAKGEGFFVKDLRQVPRFEVGIGSELRLWGDSTSALIVPYAEARVTWRGVSLGPRLDTRGLHIRLGYNWHF